MGLYRSAGEAGFLDAQLHLANLYLRGGDIARSAEMASVWFRLAAEQGHTGAQLQIAVMYCTGRASPSIWRRRQNGIAAPPSRATASRSTISR